MTTLKIPTTAGEVTVEGRRFSHYIRNVQFWFFFHKSTDHVNINQVTHIASGARVCFVPWNSMIAGVGMQDVDVARAEIDRLVASKGADRVYDVLTRAEKNADEYRTRAMTPNPRG